MKRFVIDRFSGAWAYLEDEAGDVRRVRRALLPRDAREGAALNFDGAAFERAPQDARRRARIAAKLRDLLD